MDILESLNALKADYSAAQTLLEEAKLSSEGFIAQIAEKESAIESLNDSLASKAEEVSSLVSKLEAAGGEISELKAAIAALKAQEKSAEERAVDLVANVGIKPIKADYSAEAVAMDKAQVITGMQAIKDPVERAKFYFANKALLFGGK